MILPPVTRISNIPLAAQNAMGSTSPRKWKRQSTSTARRPTQLPTASTMHNLPKWKGAHHSQSADPSLALSDRSDSSNSSESLLSANSDEQKMSSTHSSSDDSLDLQSISPKAIPRAFPTLPTCDGSSPPTLCPRNASRGIPVPKSYNFSMNLARKQSQRPKYITDGDAVSEYLSDRAAASSALGMSGVTSWSKSSGSKDVDDSQLQATRESIVRRANEPLVAPKDAWDMALDSGAAYPQKAKSVRDPFRDFDRKQRNPFQTTQAGHAAGTHRFEKGRKKKGAAHNQHRLKQRRKRRMNV